MALSDDINSNVETILTTSWKKRNGTVVPNSTDIALAGGAVELDATYLYSDFADSSKIAKLLDRRVVAKNFKSFLTSATRSIKHRGGSVVSFDGDRILAVFIGDSKNTSAARCALNINYAVTKVIRPKFESKYSSIKENGIILSHGTGVDTGTILMVRAGARGNNDIISIGRAANLAAKLSDIREGNYKSFIAASVYNSMHKSSKYSSKNENMWQSLTFQYLGESISIYRSNWHWGK